MPIDLSTPPVPISFEVYPPRTDSGWPALYATIAQLASVDPRFISVTFGAGGSTGGRSLDLLRHILHETSVEPLAHLTCVGSTYEDTTALIREFLDAGIRSFLALRGDPPIGIEDDAAFVGDIESAAELIQLIGRVQADRGPSAGPGIPGAPDAAGAERSREVDVAVAAFPNGHPRSRHASEHIDALLAKQAAGATLAITQLFFYADDYLSFVQRCRDAGVTIPILPGIMPITSPTRLRRTLELSGEATPTELAVALEEEPTAEGRHEIGVDHAARLTRDVLDGGAPGIHLYAFNNADTVLAVLRQGGVLARSL